MLTVRWFVVRHVLSIALLCALSSVILPVQAQRLPVLDQIDLPHAYYFREMYLPQLTNGPSSVAWSPDSKMVVYSRAGSLWIQEMQSTTAIEMSNDAGYDYQPDWSPDGRWLVYASYQNGAVELFVRDMKSWKTRQITFGGAVNVEPRWSPDSKQIVFVSTAFNKRFHIFKVDVTADSVGTPVRLTGETTSDVNRYYYSPFDHEISPVWTRDGKSIIFVSNHGHIYGTGGFWKMEATPGAVPHEIHYEETNWRARPDVSPDGSRLVYGSYLGRNTHQLWMLPVEGGDALPISYGDSDSVNPRWSPDGREIAYISNSLGDTSLWIYSLKTSMSRPMLVTQMQTIRRRGAVVLNLLNADGSPGVARISVTDSKGLAFAPPEARLYSDDSYDRHERPFEAHYFYAKGKVTIPIPAGDAKIEILRGLRQPLETHALSIEAGKKVEIESKAVDVPLTALGGGRWVSADAHVHMNYGGTYRMLPETLLEQAAGEDLDIVHALIVNKEQRVPDIAYSGLGLDLASKVNRTLVHGQEFHTSYWGHLGLLGMGGPTMVPGYAGYPHTAAASLMPMNADVADRAHVEGALVGYVHPFDTEPHPFNALETLTNELPVDVALGKVDYMEILGFADHRATANVWYRLLNLGFRVPAAAGTDAMANFASLRGPVGLNRVYVRVPEGQPVLNQWMDGLKAGATFATNGPLLDFTLGNQPIGGSVAVAKSGASLGFTAHLKSIVPVDHLEVVCNGRVVKTLALKKPRMSADVTSSVTLNSSGWCILRASSDRAEYPILDNYVYATTSPIYVSVAGKAAHSAEDAKYFLAWLDRLNEAVAKYVDWNSADEQTTVLDRIKAAREIYAKLE
jgi:hypothetical protein